MTVERRVVVSLGGALVVVSAVSIGRADGPSIAYSAFEGCPSERAFVDDVASRIHAGAAEGKSFSVVLERRGARVGGRVEATDRGGRRVRRVLEGESCGEVASALALVVALAIDPRASLTPAPPPVASPDPPLPPPPPPVAASPDPPPVPSAAPPPAPLAPPTIDGEAPDGRPVRWAAGAGALFVSPVAPSGAFGATVFVEASRGLDGPAARLGMLYAPRDLGLPGGGAARFRYWAARLDACPVRFAPASSLVLAPCGGVDVGALVATGVDLAETRSETRFFGAALGLARAEWTVIAPFSIEGSGGLFVPFVRDQFVVDRPRSQVHTPSAVGGTVQIDGVAHFP